MNSPANEMAQILIVDDDPGARDALEGLLLREDYELAFATDGTEALACLDQFSPDVILLDVMMPGMDGFQVCRILKASEVHRHIPVILVTALDSRNDLVRGLDAGADEFLSKPINGSELRARVRSVLRNKRQYDLLESQRRELEAALHVREELAHVTAQRLTELELLNDLGLRLMNSSEQDEIAEAVSRVVLQAIPRAAHCALYCGSQEEFDLGAPPQPIVFSAQDHSRRSYRALGIEGVVRQAMESGEIIYVRNVSADLGYVHPTRYEMCSLLLAPLIAGEQSIGVLSVDSPKEDAFEATDRRLLSILSSQTAVAIAKVRFFEELQLLWEREKLSIRNLFRRYVSPTVVDRLIEGKEGLALGGNRREVSVLFADIRGFTSYSEHLAPERLIEVLNDYLALAVEAILAEEGTLDKFMGDAVMALFNVPLSQPDHTLCAARAALSMQRAIARHNAETQEESRLSFGIGIHVGEAVVGNVGTEQQMNYTAIGDTVNVAKRLQENASGGQIVLSHAAHEAVKEYVVAEDLGLWTVKGRTTPERVYSLVGLAEQT